VVEAIIGYLDQDVFADLNDLYLWLPSLHQSGLHSQRQSPHHTLCRLTQQFAALPLAAILHSLALLIFGELGQQILPLQFWTIGSAEIKIGDHIERIALHYEREIDKRIAMITATPPSPPSRKSPTKSLKRGRVSEVASPSTIESKASKNARLRRAMEEVNRTIGQMEGGDLHSGVSFVA